jgi:hypothetical protein
LEGVDLGLSEAFGCDVNEVEVEASELCGGVVEEGFDFFFGRRGWKFSIIVNFKFSRRREN